MTISELRKKTFMALSKEKQTRIKHKTASEEELARMREAGSNWHKKASEEELARQREAGSNWHKTAEEEELAKWFSKV